MKTKNISLKKAVIVIFASLGLLLLLGAQSADAQFAFEIPGTRNLEVTVDTIGEAPAAAETAKQLVLKVVVEKALKETKANNIAIQLVFHTDMNDGGVPTRTCRMPSFGTKVRSYAMRIQRQAFMAAPEDTFERFAFHELMRIKNGYIDGISYPGAEELSDDEMNRRASIETFWLVGRDRFQKYLLIEYSHLGGRSGMDEAEYIREKEMWMGVYEKPYKPKVEEAKVEKPKVSK